MQDASNLALQLRRFNVCFLRIKREREKCNIYDQDHSWVSAGHIVFYKARSVSDASDKIDGVISRVFVQLFFARPRNYNDVGFNVRLRL